MDSKTALRKNIQGKTFENLSSDKKYPFRNEVWAIMTSLGVITDIDGGSVQTMQEIVYNQMKLLLYKAEKVALMRPKKPHEKLEIFHGDILFLMRPYRVKIKRLLEYLNVMDLKPSFNNVVRNDDDDEEEVTPLVQKKTDTKVGQCLQFFAKIEDCNEFRSIWKDKIIDIERKRKLERRELMTKFMTQQEYDRYHELLPKATFCYQENQRPFKRWLLKRIIINSQDMDLTRLAVTILEFLARETIVNVVDMALQIKAVKRKKVRKKDNKDRKKICRESDIISFNLPNSDDEEEGKKPVDDTVTNEGVLTDFKNMFFRDTEKCNVESVSDDKKTVDTSELSEDFKIFINQIKITKKEVIDAYMQFQFQRKPWLYFGDPYWKNTTLICLANVDDHKLS